MHRSILFPRSPHRWWAPTLGSVVLHGAALALLILRPPFTSSAPPRLVDEVVRFFLPPDQVAGMRSVGEGLDWSGVVNPGGVADVEAPAVVENPEALAVGRPGELQPAGSGDASPTPAFAEGGVRAGEEETALTEIEVDSAVVRDPNSAAPVYPAVLLTQNIQGSTYVEYVVDTTGLVDTTTIRILATTHPEFARAVREALAAMRFRPALHAGIRVRQFVQQNFAFRILPPTAAPPDPPQRGPVPAGHFPPGRL